MEPSNGVNGDVDSSTINRAYLYSEVTPSSLRRQPLTTSSSLASIAAASATADDYSLPGQVGLVSS